MCLPSHTCRHAAPIAEWGGGDGPVNSARGCGSAPRVRRGPVLGLRQQASAAGRGALELPCGCGVVGIERVVRAVRVRRRELERRDGLHPVLWPFQQLGVVVWGPVLALVAAVTRRYRLAVALVGATVAKLVLERAVKAIVTRERPGTSIGSDAELRGDVSSAGESFVSGHAVMVAAIACLVAPYLPRRWRPVAWALVGMVMVGRVYVGAHNPLDVICGAALGVAIGSCLNLIVAVPASVDTVRPDVTPTH